MCSRLFSKTGWLSMRTKMSWYDIIHFPLKFKPMSKIQILTKKWNFDEKKIWNFDEKKWNFDEKLKFLLKNEIFTKKWNFY